MIQIRQAVPGDRPAVCELFGEYLRWVCPRLYDEYKVEFDAETILSHDMATLEIFMPPRGWLFLALEDDKPVGCACTREVAECIAELKRMYVRPDHRRQGAGRLLVAATIDATRAANYAALRLDSAGFMLGAHALYRSCGFRDRPPYDESEIPPEYRQHWVFMELDLAAPPRE